MLKKVLVTGATGFIGNHVINELLKIKDIEVIATSRNEKKAYKQSWYKKVKYIQYDLNENKSNLLKLFDYPEIIIHLAWEGLPNYNDNIHIEKNLFNNYNFLKSLIDSGLSNIVCIGSCFEYGMQNGKLVEDLYTTPNTTYGLAKDCLRKFLQDYQKNTNFTLKWVRLFYIYGEGQSENSIFGQLNKAIENGDKSFNMSKGEQLRDYLDIYDVAKNICKITLQDKIVDIINCGKGEPISIRTLIENQLLIKKSNIFLNLGYYDYPKYEPMAFWADIKKLSLIKNKNAK